MYFIKILKLFFIIQCYDSKKVSHRHEKKHLKYIYVKNLPDKRLMSRIYKELLQFENKKSKFSIIDGLKILMDISMNNRYKW